MRNDVEVGDGSLEWTPKATERVREPGMPVSFGGVSCAYRDKEGDEQHVLHECAGSFLPGQISAI
eukprot:scaffold3655_cov878-Pavlova_lutheri.AAC.1